MYAPFFVHPHCMNRNTSMYYYLLNCCNHLHARYRIICCISIASFNSSNSWARELLFSFPMCWWWNGLRLLQEDWPEPLKGQNLGVNPGLWVSRMHALYFHLNAFHCTHKAHTPWHGTWRICSVGSTRCPITPFTNIFCMLMLLQASFWTLRMQWRSGQRPPS